MECGNAALVRAEIKTNANLHVRHSRVVENQPQDPRSLAGRVREEQRQRVRESAPGTRPVDI